MADALFAAPNASSTRGLVNKVGADHHEPTTSYNPWLAYYTVAWFKLFVDETSASLGQDWEDAIFGDTTTSVCGGGDGDMAECKFLRGSETGAARWGGRMTSVEMP